MDKLTAIRSFESIDRFHFLLTTIYQFIYSYPSLFHVGDISVKITVIVRFFANANKSCYFLHKLY